MGVLGLLEAFSEEVSHMAEYDKNEVRDISSDQVEVWGLVHDRIRH